jgi:RHS repeat-associated protein
MSGNLLRAWQPGFSDIQTKYDLGTKTASTIFSFAGQTKTLTSTTGTDGLEGSTTLISGVNKSAQFDSLNRETVTTIGNLNKLTAYLDVSGNRTTNIPSSVTYKNGDTTLLASSYTYDDNGNIATMTVGNTTYAYTYDANNQLKTVSTNDNSYSASYNYDNGGNITSKTVNGVTTAYGYGDTNWKDKLTSYDGQSITYDEIGNPLSYRGMTMSWTGRRLNSITNSGVSNSYLYDANGIRTRKTVGSTVTEYFTNGSTILAEKTGSNVLWYIYDSDGEILGFIYNGTPYYYIKNVQGDVYKVVNASGSVVASYTYDAWGKVLSSTGSMAQINSIRYRSYYYDAETGFYYLQSRYYDPETGRFLNADDTANLGADGSILSYNLFVYCLNNPVNRFDVDGNWSLPNWAKVVIGAVALAGAIALTVATGGGAAAVAVGVAKVVTSVAVSTAVSAGVGYLNNGKQGAIDGACNGFMFGSLSACGGAALKYASSVANKASVAASVSEPKKVANAITGYTKHGLNQAIGRNGVGVKPSAILDAVRNPVNVVTKTDKLGRISTQYRGAQSTVVLNEIGKVVSCWAKSSKYWRI